MFEARVILKTYQNEPVIALSINISCSLLNFLIFSNEIFSTCNSSNLPYFASYQHVVHKLDMKPNSVFQNLQIYNKMSSTYNNSEICHFFGILMFDMAQLHDLSRIEDNLCYQPGFKKPNLHNFSSV